MVCCTWCKAIECPEINEGVRSIEGSNAAASNGCCLSPKSGSAPCLLLTFGSCSRCRTTYVLRSPDIIAIPLPFATVIQLCAIPCPSRSHVSGRTAEINSVVKHYMPLHEQTAVRTWSERNMGPKGPGRKRATGEEDMDAQIPELERVDSVCSGGSAHRKVHLADCSRAWIGDRRRCARCCAQAKVESDRAFEITLCTIVDGAETITVKCEGCG